jgi:hypothetical protein
LSVGVPARILDHIQNRFKLRFANKATFILRDKVGTDSYGRTVWSETTVDAYIFMRVYRVRGIENVVLGRKPEANFIFSVGPLSPRNPQEGDLIIVDGFKYEILAVSRYTDQDGNILMTTGLARKYETGEA